MIVQIFSGSCSGIFIFYNCFKVEVSIGSMSPIHAMLWRRTGLGMPVVESLWSSSAVHRFHHEWICVPSLSA